MGMATGAQHGVKHLLVRSLGGEMAEPGNQNKRSPETGAEGRVYTVAGDREARCRQSTMMKVQKDSQGKMKG